MINALSTHCSLVGSMNGFVGQLWRRGTGWKKVKFDVLRVMIIVIKHDKWQMIICCNTIISCQTGQALQVNVIEFAVGKIWIKMMPVPHKFAPDVISRQGVYTSLVKLLTCENSNHWLLPASRPATVKYSDQLATDWQWSRSPISYCVVGINIRVDRKWPFLESTRC